jgi:hypothetical protein
VVPIKLETTTFRIELGTPVSSPPILSMIPPPLSLPASNGSHPLFCQTSSPASKWPRKDV